VIDAGGPDYVVGIVFATWQNALVDVKFYRRVEGGPVIKRRILIVEVVLLKLKVRQRA
jgi:hypothetical protein